MCVWEVAQLCPTLCHPMDYNLPGSCVHGILQARVLEWVAISYSRGSSRPRDRTNSHPRPEESGTLRVGPANSVLTNRPGLMMTPSLVLGPATLASSGSLLEMPSLRSQLGPTESAFPLERQEVSYRLTFEKHSPESWVTPPGSYKALPGPLEKITQPFISLSPKTPRLPGRREAL